MMHSYNPLLVRIVLSTSNKNEVYYIFCLFPKHSNYTIGICPSNLLELSYLIQISHEES